MPGAGSGPQGVVTRGTTNINRLRRSDRRLVHHPTVRALLRTPAHPLVVDLGYGASPVTTVELAQRLRTVRPDVAVVGLEIDPGRVVPDRDGVRFRHGGFELAGLRPHLVRAFNVLRQYPEDAVAGVWARVTSSLAEGGLLIDGTCDELGRRAAWVTVGADGPRSLTLAWDPFDLPRPSDIAERLPKALIHRNVPGEGVHDLLRDLDDAWARTAGWATYGARAHAVEAFGLLAQRWPVLDGPRRWRLGELTLAWEPVAPASPA